MSQNEPYERAKDSASCWMLCDMMGDVEPFLHSKWLQLCLRASVHNIDQFFEFDVAHSRWCIGAPGKLSAVSAFDGGVNLRIGALAGNACIAVCGCTTEHVVLHV